MCLRTVLVSTVPRRTATATTWSETSPTRQWTRRDALSAIPNLAGPDASKFQISGDPPVLSFVTKPDFEAKASADRDNVYEVTVRASAGGDTGERMVRVTVSNVDEGPDVSGHTEPTRNYAENSEDVVATFTADGPRGRNVHRLVPERTMLQHGDDVETPTIADNAHFTIDGEDGMLKFMDPPDNR